MKLIIVHVCTRLQLHTVPCVFVAATVVNENRPFFHAEVFSKHVCPRNPMVYLQFPLFELLHMNLEEAPFVSLRQHFCPCIEQPEPSAHKDCHGSTSPCLETTKWPPAKAPSDTRCWEKTGWRIQQQILISPYEMAIEG